MKATQIRRNIPKINEFLLSAVLKKNGRFRQNFVNFTKLENAF